MKLSPPFDQEDFDALLDWLSADRNESGEIYEQVRLGLTRFFRFKGCIDPENLADETITRVATKVSSLDSSKNVKKITIFLGFANNILHEHNRNKNVTVDIDSIVIVDKTTSEVDDNSQERRLECLGDCLQMLSDDERTIILGYYSKDKGEKIEARRLIAAQFQYDLNALQVKAFRIRNGLGKCVRRCLKKKV